MNEDDDVVLLDSQLFNEGDLKASKLEKDFL